jgi:transcriptional regulator with XRE-family HTH domain
VVDLIRAKEFGGEIKALRKEKNMGLRELARATDISSTYLSYIEQGIHGPPSPEKVKKLAAALGENPDRLLRVAGHVDPALSEWMKSRQETIGPAVRESEAPGGSLASTGTVVFVLAVAFLMALAQREKQVSESDSPKVDSDSIPNQVTAAELYAQLRESMADEGIKVQKDYAALLHETGKLWLADLKALETGKKKK